MPALQHERRRFFRVNDTIGLCYTPVDEATANNAFERRVTHSLGRYSLAATLDLLSQESRQLMLRMDKQQPEMLELFKILDAKIGAIAQAVMVQNSDIATQDSRDVNLSATGLAFHEYVAMPVGQYLEIQMFLPKAMSVIVVYGKVVNCKTVSTDDYLISIDYTHVNEDDRELLIKHVVRTQWQQHREAIGHD